MKQVFKNILMIIYSFVSMFILGMAILYPFGMNMKDFNPYGWFIIYPLAIIIMATQNICMQYFFNNQKK